MHAFMYAIGGAFFKMIESSVYILRNGTNVDNNNIY